MTNRGEYRAVVTPAVDYTGELTFTVVMIEDNAGNVVESSATATSFLKVNGEKDC